MAARQVTRRSQRRASSRRTFETKTGTHDRPRRSLRRNVAATEALKISTPDYVRAFLTWLNLLFALVPTA